jgi:hypothetical protein
MSQELVLGWKGLDSSSSLQYVPYQNHPGRENRVILQLISNSSGDEDIDEIFIPGRNRLSYPLKTNKL